MKYIALLRGINISGQNKISMSELKLELEKNKYQNVSTYLNSGNVIFESTINNKEDIMKDIYKIIKNKFNLEIPIFVMTSLELEDILNNNPKCRNCTYVPCDLSIKVPVYSHLRPSWQALPRGGTAGIIDKVYNLFRQRRACCEVH